MEYPLFNNLFIFEMANNHMGDLDHGLEIIRQVRRITKGFDFKFAFKLQYRDLDTFIHPAYRDNMEFKYVKRFSQTRLEKGELKKLKDEITRNGFISVCTPFDENSVLLAESHGFDIIKIGSCSFTDWPLLERIAKTAKPLIASVAGASLEDIDRVVSFLVHRKKELALMHAVAQYPTKNSNLELSQIDLLRARYPQISVGYSTHEDPGNLDAIKIAIAKGAKIFEKHVGLKTKEFALNDYSLTPGQVLEWLNSAKGAMEMCGNIGSRMEFSNEEKSSLSGLRRGVFAKTPINKGQKIELTDLFLAIPTFPGQVTANELSKYTEFHALTDIQENAPVLHSALRQVDNREKIYCIVKQVKGILKKAKVFIPGRLDFEVSHHYGVDRFAEYGATIINVINREYCKKLIVLIPKQAHPEQYHKLKEETFHVLYGDVLLCINGVSRECKSGDVITIERSVRHSFCSKNGAVIEEISSTHYDQDSYYTDEAISRNNNRKTLITYW